MSLLISTYLLTISIYAVFAAQDQPPVATMHSSLAMSASKPAFNDSSIGEA